MYVGVSQNTVLDSTPFQRPPKTVVVQTSGWTKNRHSFKDQKFYLDNFFLNGWLTVIIGHSRQITHGSLLYFSSWYIGREIYTMRAQIPPDLNSNLRQPLVRRFCLIFLIANKFLVKLHTHTFCIYLESLFHNVSLTRCQTSNGGCRYET